MTPDEQADMLSVLAEVWSLSHRRKYVSAN
jgi:hypothetical protein